MNILIVDDESDSLTEIQYYVNKYGGFDSCVVCNNATEALDQATNLSFDVALLDIEIPGMSGLELAKQMSILFPEMALVFITAYNHYATEAFEVNAFDYILKPIREDRLFKTLKRITEIKLDKLCLLSEDRKLSINMLRKFSLRIDNVLVKWNRKKSAEILAFLIENKEHQVHKDMLCELFWPDLDPKRALMNLHTTIYSIRKVLVSNNISQIRIDYVGSSYLLYLKDTSSDVDELEYLMKRAVDTNDITLLEKAVSFYTGDYLEEEGWLWAEPKKVMLQRKYQLILELIKETKRAQLKAKSINRNTQKKARNY